MDLDDEIESKEEQTPWYRRDILKLLGGVTVGGSALGYYLQSGDRPPDGGNSSTSPDPDRVIDPRHSLTSQRTQDEYWTAPPGDLDPAEMRTGELGWSQKGRVGIKTDEGFAPLPVGSRAHPAPSIHARRLSNQCYASAYPGSDGGEQIQNAINDATSTMGQSTVIVDGPGTDSPGGPNQENVWALSSPLRIPSQTTLLLCDATLFLTADSNCPLLVNDDISGGNERIFIEGLGGVRFDGNNSAQQDKQFNDGIGLAFVNVDNFAIRNVSIGNTRRWMSLISGCSDGSMENLRYFLTSQSGGNHDGLKVHASENLYISNIRGNSGDDLLSLSTYENPGTIPGGAPHEGEVRFVEIENVKKTEGPFRIKFVTGYDSSPNQMQDIQLRGIRSSRAIVWETGFAPNPPEKGDVRGFIISHVNARFDSSSQSTLFRLAGVDDVILSDIKLYVTDRGGVKLLQTAGTMPMENIQIRGVIARAYDGGGWDALIRHGHDYASEIAVSDVMFDGGRLIRDEQRTKLAGSVSGINGSGLDSLVYTNGTGSSNIEFGNVFGVSQE